MIAARLTKAITRTVVKTEGKKPRLTSEYGSLMNTFSFSGWQRAVREEEEEEEAGETTYSEAMPYRNVV